MDIFQTLFNGIAIGAMAALVALGLGLIFNTSRIFHMAHGGVYTLAAFFAYMWNVQLGLPFWASVVLAIPMTVVLGMLCEALVYRPMRSRGADHHTMMIASLGLLFALEGLAALIWGINPKVFTVQRVSSSVELGPVVFTYLRLITIGVSLGLTAIVVWFLVGTRAGKAIRAIANNPDRARLVGINVDWLLLLTYGIGSALAVAPAIILGVDRGLFPGIGLLAMILAAVALIVGGIGSLPGAVIGAYIIGMFTSIITRYVGGQWQNAIVFSILIALLILRPKGLLGERTPKAEV